MATPAEEAEFFEQHREALLAAAADGALGVALAIRKFEKDDERRILYLEVSRTFSVPGGPDLDVYAEICEAGISEMRRLADRAEDEEERAQWIAAAHAISFQLAANLADCRPEDERHRSAGHFRRGLRAAEDCIDWCPPDDLVRLSRDYWAKGMHLVALGDTEAAREAWEESLALVTRYAESKGLPTAVSPDGYFGVMLASGLVGVAKMMLGDKSGTNQWLAAVTAFGYLLGDEEKAVAVSASGAIGQMEQIRKKYGGLEYGEGHYEEE